jgi:hypothetical protein
MIELQRLTDESIRRLYNSIREQVAQDVRSGSRHRFMGDTARRQAERLREELDRRRLKFMPIEW